MAEPGEYFSPHYGSDIPEMGGAYTYGNDAGNYDYSAEAEAGGYPTSTPTGNSAATNSQSGRFGLPSEVSGRDPNQGRNPYDRYSGPASMAPIREYGQWEQDNRPGGYRPIDPAYAEGRGAIGRSPQSDLSTKYDPKAGAAWWDSVVKSGATQGYGWTNADMVNRSWSGGNYRAPAPAPALAYDDNGGRESQYGGQGTSNRWLPNLEELVRTGVIPPRLAAALTPLIPGGPDYNYSLRPQGGYRPISRQTYNRLNPTDLEALYGTLQFMGNRPDDFLADYQQPQYAPQVRYGGRVRLG